MTRTSTHKFTFANFGTKEMLWRAKKTIGIIQMRKLPHHTMISYFKTIYIISVIFVYFILFILKIISNYMYISIIVCPWQTLKSSVCCLCQKNENYFQILGVLFPRSFSLFYFILKNIIKILGLLLWKHCKI